MTTEKKLIELLNTIETLDVSGILPNCTIYSLAFDSRDVSQGSLFFALPGNTVHGNDFIEEAIEKGAIAIIYQKTIPQDKADEFSKKVSLIKVKDSRFAMSP